jgi:O-antigen/teichoic acid export membrane protein
MDTRGGVGRAAPGYDGVSVGSGIASRFVPPFVNRLAPFKRIIGTTGGLMLATVINSGTGFVFWWIAARQFPEAAVGLAGAAVAAMLMLSQASVLGLGTTLAGVLHREPRAAALAVSAFLSAASVGAVLGLGFVVVAPLISSEFSPMSAGLAMVLFALGVSVTALNTVLDQVLASSFRAMHQVGRTAIFGFGRLGLLMLAAVLLTPHGMVIYGAWVASAIVSLVVISLLPHHIGRMGEIFPLPWGQLGGMAFGALSHHVLTLSRASSVSILPVLVTGLISGEANASFYVALLLANFIAVVCEASTFTLYVVGARSPLLLWRQIRFTLVLTGSVTVLGTLVLALFGREILGIFGPTYAGSAYPAIVVLAASTIALVIKDHWIAIQRVRGTVGRASAIGVATLALELGAAATGAVLAGVLGLALARLAVLVVEATLMLPVVLRELRPTPAGPDRSAWPASERAGDLPQ